MILDYDKTALAAAIDDADEGILDGKAVANALLEQLRPLVHQFKVRQIHPALTVVQVGEDEASTLYIRHKMNACETIGVRSQHHVLNAETTYPELIARLKQINQDPMVHGVLLQLPLPQEMDGAEAMQHIDPRKDVDGFHPANLGCLMARKALLEPCTPRGILTLLRAAGIDVQGRDAVVVGRSVIVGRPMAMMLARANATVTLCHRHTADLEAAVRRADVIVVATGVAELIKGDWIQEGAVVIDVGINRKDGALCGDVEFDRARERSRWITPVPGGVGPMTVATLMENTVRATCIQEQHVVRNGNVMTADDADVYFETIEGTGFTHLRQGTPVHRSLL